MPWVLGQFSMYQDGFHPTRPPLLWLAIAHLLKSTAPLPSKTEQKQRDNGQK
jgi:hypothetical protein